MSRGQVSVDVRYRRRRGNQEATPLVWNRTLYGITNGSVVFALDAVTGKELWRWDPEVNNDGRLLAYRADQDEELLEIPTGRPGMGPLITYAAAGAGLPRLQARTMQKWIIRRCCSYSSWMKRRRQHHIRGAPTG